MAITKAQAQSTLAAMGWKEDRFGNFKSAKGTIRVKLQATSLRVEREYQPPESFGYKPPKQWLNVASDYYSHLSIADGRLVVKGLKLLAQEQHLPNARQGADHEVA